MVRGCKGAGLGASADVDAGGKGVEVEVVARAGIGVSSGGEAGASVDSLVGVTVGVDVEWSVGIRSTGSAGGFVDNCLNRRPGTVRNLAVLANFLGHKLGQAGSVFNGVRHLICGHQFITVAPNSRAECRVHFFYIIHITGQNQHKIAGNWGGADHATASARRTAGRCNASLLSSSINISRLTY